MSGRDYKTVSLFSRRYLDTYYRKVTEDEALVAQFLAEYGRRLARKDFRILEIGCGPTIHHALALAPYASSMDLADYLPENLEEIRRWKEGNPESFSWNHYTGMILKKEGVSDSASAVQEREQVLREKIHALLECDVEMSPPVAGKRYSLVTTFYCAEEVATTEEEWIKVMDNISMMLEPGGHLFLSALRNTTHYALEHPSGGVESLPCVAVTQDLLHDYLEASQYKLESIEVHSLDTPSLVRFGIPGILFCTAQKK